MREKLSAKFFMGIDIGSIVGVSIINDIGEQQILTDIDLSGKISKCGWNFKKTNSRQQKFKNFRKVIRHYLGFDATYEAVIIETPFHRGLAATRMLWGFAGILEEVLPCPLHTVAPNTLKKYATGSGKATKEDMIKTVELMLGGPAFIGSERITEHQADALLLSHYLYEDIKNGNKS